MFHGNNPKKKPYLKNWNGPAFLKDWNMDNDPLRFLLFFCLNCKAFVRLMHIIKCKKKAVYNGQGEFSLVKLHVDCM